MAGSSALIASSTGSVEFRRLSAEEIRRISVKRLHVTPSFDTLQNPVPGGLYDPALGAIRDLEKDCATCRMSEVHCPGHCGHIELPVACYHATYLDSTLRLLRAKCVYCHRLRLPRTNIHFVSCQLRLLQYGLVDSLRGLEELRRDRKRKRPAVVNGATHPDEAEFESSSEDDGDTLFERRALYVKSAIRKAEKRDPNLSFNLLKNPAAVAERKNLIASFLRDIAAFKKCSHCQGITPGYRKDRNVKIFKNPLSKSQQAAMIAAEKRAVNPLLYLMEQEKQMGQGEKPLTNGWHKDDDELTGQSETLAVEHHGAEEEITLNNALETAAEAEEIDLGDEGSVQQYMTPTEVRAALQLLFEKEQEIMRLIFAPSPGRKEVPVSSDMFFITNILVPPNRFRSPAKQGGNIIENQQNGPLNRIIKACNDLLSIARELKSGDTGPAGRRRQHSDHINAGVILQEAVNALLDHTPNPNSGKQNEIGIKQILEKKEGLFRMNMMGKRVNYAARSVISPDPNIESNEIGVPLVFAQKLTYAEPVTSHNFQAMKTAVENGMEKYPGAAAIENEHGQVLNLKFKNAEQRKAIAKQLLTPTGSGTKGDRSKKVYRHLQTGDVVIMNRQPTLHKPSMMGHRVRVLHREKTIRMHYANCNTYNADFDGDEMNMHFPQNEIARSEALQIADTDHQYLSATAGKPLRGLIQDHISMGVQFTKRDVFFTRDQYQELLYNCLRPEEFNANFPRIQTVPPAIVKPQALWTGKQVITTILKNITPQGWAGLNVTGKSSTSAERWGEQTEPDPAKFSVTAKEVSFRDTEAVVIFKDGEHMCGILDKAQLGPSVGGLVHSVYEIYGHIVAGKLLSTVGRLLTRYLNERAWSCGMDDLYLTKEGDHNRKRELQKARKVGAETAAKYVSLEPGKTDRTQLLARLEDVLRNDDQAAGLDQMYNSTTKFITDAITKECLPTGLRKPFPRNQMQAMTTSGAKGSNVNANLISCNLGQQVLEGRRVPTMVSGKTLPSFRPFETDPVAGGYVSGRFLTGIRPQEYFFHAMSGREGLIDTAVKTSKSGYLQRCIVKGTEGLKTEHDTSVRESTNGTIVQFLYGEDGLEVTKQKHLQEFTFMAANNSSISTSIRMAELHDQIRNSEFEAEQKAILATLTDLEPKHRDPLMSQFSPSSKAGSTSETFFLNLARYVKKNPDQLLRDHKKGIRGVVSKKAFQAVMEVKYMKSVVDAGEAVGVVAAQSIGEPSTQMTLNTFHLAGHSAKNVTLGIPRLREIVMTASANIMTPTMTLKPIEELSVEHATVFAKSISRLSLAQIIASMSLHESSAGQDAGQGKIYDIRIDLYPAAEYTTEHAIEIEDVALTLENKFVGKLEKLIKDEIRKKHREGALSEVTAAMPDIGASVGRVEEARPERTTAVDREGGDADIDEDADPEDAKQNAARERNEDNFDEPDDDEVTGLVASGDEADNGDGKPMSTPARAGQEREDRTDSEMVSSDDEIEKQREAILTQTNPHLQRFKFSRSEGQFCRIVMSYPSSTPKLLLLPILEKCARDSLIQSIPGLGQCTLSREPVQDPITGKTITVLNQDSGKEEEQRESVITTEGVNLLAVRDYQDILNPHTIYTNSIHETLRYYGVEAARATIIREIDTVFRGHGIGVDNRHLNLIADAMTQSGGYKAFSRNGIVKESGSVFAKMSFETVTGFLKEAVLFGEMDPLLGPSARIVAGRRGNVGTGSFDVLVPVS